MASPELSEKLAGPDPPNDIHTWVDEMQKALHENMYCGNQMQPTKRVKKYMKKFAVKNLYRYRLPEWHRAMYSVYSEGASGQNGLSVVILEIMDHNRYSEVFGYETT